MLMLNDWLAAIGEDCDQNKIVEKIAVDNRECDNQTWWLATQGLAHHALDFYTPYLEVAGILYEPPYANPPKGAIAVPNLSDKVSALADIFYQHPSKQMRVIGVTGTDGKSSLVHFLAQALDAAMLGTIGYGRLTSLKAASHTTPDALRVQALLSEFVKNNVQVAAMEVSSHALAQGRVASVHFDTAVFSNLSRDHLDYHKDMEDYFLAKARLFAYPLKTAIINIDDEYGRRLITENRINKTAEVWTVSSHDAVPLETAYSLTAENIDLHGDGIALTLNFNGNRQYVQTKLLARFNVDNLLNVAACLLSGGKTLSETAAILTHLNGVPGRVERIELGKHRNAIVDYAHTAGAIESALQGIRPHVDGKLWIVFGCGGDRDKGKRPLMAMAAEKFADMVVITDDNPRTEDPEAIVKEVANGISNLSKVRIIQPREAAIEYALNQLKNGDTLLIAGKGHEDYQIIGTTKHHFSDQEQVRQWLKK